MLIEDEQVRLHRKLARVVPEAKLSEDPRARAETLAKVVAAVAAPGAECDVPLDIRGSEIGMAVWQVLGQISPGETGSYGQIAKALPVTATAQELCGLCRQSARGRGSVPLGGEDGRLRPVDTDNGKPLPIMRGP